MLVTYVRRGDLNLSQAQALLEEAEDLMGGSPAQVDGARVLALASSSSCSAYDCEFVAAAEALGVRLVTTDARILRNFPSIGVSLADFATPSSG